MLFLYGAAIFCAAFAGGALPLLVPQLSEKRLHDMVSLGAGLLLGIALLHMLPEAAELLPPGSFGGWFLLGFLILMFLERFVMVHACEESHCDYHTIGIAAFVGLAIHGAIEGFALASTALTTQLGPAVLLAILAHKVPAGMALTSILKLGKQPAKRVWTFAVGVALSGPLGLLVATKYLQGHPVPGAAGVLLAVSSGTFLYIAACDLLPEMHRASHRWLRLALFTLGLAMSWISVQILG